MSIVKMGDVNNQSEAAEYLVKSIANHEKTTLRKKRIFRRFGELLFFLPSLHTSRPYRNLSDTLLSA